MKAIDKSMIQVEDLRKSYGPLTAVDGVSFFVEAGKVFGILGPNGAGKTTTIEIIEGMIRPTPVAHRSAGSMPTGTLAASRG